MKMSGTHAKKAVRLRTQRSWKTCACFGLNIIPASINAMKSRGTTNAGAPPRVEMEAFGLHVGFATYCYLTSQSSIVILCKSKIVVLTELV